MDNQASEEQVLMTKTVKQVLERVRNKGFNDRCQQEKHADIDNQFVVALSVDQALKELEAIHQQEIAKARLNEVQNAYEYWINGRKFISSYFRDRISLLSNTKESK